MTGAAFSSSETSALEREVEKSEESAELTLQHIWNENNQKVSVGWIKQNGYKKICLQFPDDYLPHSVHIADDLTSALNAEAKVFIMADTSYGSCCVDEVAAAHVQGDCILHFGNACRSKAAGLPVLYLFPELQLELPAFLDKLKSLQDVCQQKNVIIYLDIGYHQLLDKAAIEQETAETSLKTQIQVILSAKQLNIVEYPPAELAECDYVSTDDCIVIFVGADNQRFANLSLSVKASAWYVYNPGSNTLEVKNPLLANYIRRRYYFIEKCKDAQLLGLIVATLTSTGYLDVVARLQNMAKKRGMRTKLISVGRINPAKLANFLEIDCFVLIGCPFNNLYNIKGFYKPVVSVFEAEMALNPAWHMKYPETYVTDFRQLLPEGRDFLPFNEQDIVEQDVSLVNGRMRQSTGAQNGQEPDLANTEALSEQQRALVSRPRMEMMTADTGLAFEDRTWKGLDPALGQTEPAVLQKGLSGIPISYTHE